MSANIIPLRQGVSFLGPIARVKQKAQAPAASATNLKHILIIAGPSGFGKSTIMREFVENRLPADISEHLPAQAAVWKRTSGNELSRKGLSEVLRSKVPTSGLVLHYDIMRAYTRDFEYHSNDPAMRAVIDSKARLTVLTILPPREALFDQFLSRARTGEYEEWWDKREHFRRVKRKVRARLLKLAGRQPKYLKEGHLVLLKVYASDSLLNAWVSRWEIFLKHLSQGRDDVRLIYVAPDGVLDGYPRFRLLRSV
jgi:hypothetical protein